MKSFEFIIWLKGFTEACNDYTATPKQWDRIKEVLNEVQDYDDNPGIDVEIDDWFTKKVNIEPNGTPSLRYTGPTSITRGTTGYVSNSTGGTSFSNTEKQQLND
jgi:hypothetical protein